MDGEPHGDDTPDDALVARYQAGPEGIEGRAALSRLLQRWQGRVYLWAYRVVRERERALDLAQDALLQMIEALPRYEPRGRFAAWMFTIVHRRALSAVRPRSWVHDPEVDADALPSDTRGPDEAYSVGEEHERVMAAMEQALDARERLALWLRAHDGLSVDDISRLLELEGASGARGLLQTARRKLRAALEREAGPRRDES